MKAYQVQLPVIVSFETECSRPFEHNLKLEVKAKNQKDAVSRLEEMLSALLNKDA